MMTCLMHPSVHVSYSQAQKARLLHVNSEPKYKDVESCILWSDQRRVKLHTHVFLPTRVMHDFYIKRKNRKTRLKSPKRITISGRTSSTGGRHTFRFLVFESPLVFDSVLFRKFPAIPTVPWGPGSPARLPNYRILIFSRTHVSGSVLQYIRGYRSSTQYNASVNTANHL